MNLNVSIIVDNNQIKIRYKILLCSSLEFPFDLLAAFIEFNSYENFFKLIAFSDHIIRGSTCTIQCFTLLFFITIFNQMMVKNKGGAVALR